MVRIGLKEENNQYLISNVNLTDPLHLNIN